MLTTLITAVLVALLILFEARDYQSEGPRNWRTTLLRTRPGRLNGLGYWGSAFALGYLWHDRPVATAVMLIFGGLGAIIGTEIGSDRKRPGRRSS